VNTKGLLFAVFVSIIAAGCAPMLEVNQDFDYEADFAAFKTYDLMPKEDVEVSTDAAMKFADRRQVLEDELRKAIKANMEAKGFQRVNEDPDLLVAYYVGVRNEIFMSNYGMTYADITGNVMVQSVQDGSMRIDFVDPKTERLVWRGMAYGAVNRDPTEEMIRKNVDRAVKKTIDQYPPKK
jgi:hypothetical protein